MGRAGSGDDSVDPIGLRDALRIVNVLISTEHHRSPHNTAHLAISVEVSADDKRFVATHSTITKSKCGRPLCVWEIRLRSIYARNE